LNLNSVLKAKDAFEKNRPFTPTASPLAWRYSFRLDFPRPSGPPRQHPRPPN
jgi:hypothetical protein